MKVKIVASEVAALYPALAALDTVTAHVDVAEVFVVVNMSPEITHPGLLVAKLIAPSPEPPVGKSLMFSVRNTVVVIFLSLNRS